MGESVARDSDGATEVTVSGMAAQVSRPNVLNVRV